MSLLLLVEAGTTSAELGIRHLAEDRRTSCSPAATLGAPQWPRMMSGAQAQTSEVEGSSSEHPRAELDHGQRRSCR